MSKENVMRKELYLCIACIKKMQGGYRVTMQHRCAKHLCQLCRKVSISNLCWVEDRKKEII